MKIKTVNYILRAFMMLVGLCDGFLYFRSFLHVILNPEIENKFLYLAESIDDMIVVICLILPVILIKKNATYIIRIVMLLAGSCNFFFCLYPPNSALGLHNIYHYFLSYGHNELGLIDKLGYLITGFCFILPVFFVKGRDINPFIRRVMKLGGLFILYSSLSSFWAAWLVVDEMLIHDYYSHVPEILGSITSIFIYMALGIYSVFLPFWHRLTIEKTWSFFLVKWFAHLSLFIQAFLVFAGIVFILFDIFILCFTAGNPKAFNYIVLPIIGLTAFLFYLKRLIRIHGEKIMINHVINNKEYYEDHNYQLLNYAMTKKEFINKQ